MQLLDESRTQAISERVLMNFCKCIMTLSESLHKTAFWRWVGTFPIKALSLLLEKNVTHGGSWLSTTGQPPPTEHHRLSSTD
jgi:hypothetical protein